jgi:hypothetical protein
MVQMAACPTCSREMLAAHSCRIRLSAIRYGSETHPAEPWPEPCRDCGVSNGGIHHPGCCLEQCSRCGDQRLGCGCGP